VGVFPEVNWVTEYILEKKVLGTVSAFQEATRAVNKVEEAIQQ